MSSASAKIILFGEHAVVYGQPAIAVPVSALRAQATAHTSNIGFQIVARDLDDKVITFDGNDPLLEVVRLTLDALGRDVPSVSIEVQSDIPIASGLGSGAAISAAIVQTLCDYFGVKLSKQRINELVYEVERIHHGTPSGIDNTVIVYEQAVYFVREKPIEILHNHADLRILIADTGQKALTKVAVGDVRTLHDGNPEKITPVLNDIGKLVATAREAIHGGDVVQLGHLMTKNHKLLQDLTVSSDELDHLVSHAINAGAYGAKLSGGGRGGNMIALVDADTVSAVKASLLGAGAVRVFETVVKGVS
ncbi:MAG: mevalonate kinase [Chloroflexota bacterium]